MPYLQDSPAVIRDFLVYLETIMGRSINTVNQYYLDLRVFFRFLLQKRGLCPQETEFDEISICGIDLELIKSVTRSEILDFLVFTAHERPKYHRSAETTYGNEAKARARKASALRGFYKYYCDKVQLLTDNPTKGIDTPKLKKDLPKFLSLKESVSLLDAVKGPYEQRDYCIITLFLNCGMRVSELVGINISDITEDRVRITGKGNKVRMVYLNEACLSAIESYVPLRVTPKIGHKNALFISKQGKRISDQTVKWLVKKHLGAAGLEKQHLSVHKLRHTAATLMYQNGVDVRTLKEVLGHENLDTTMIYTHVLDENLRQAAERNPLAGMTGRKRTAKDKNTDE